MAACRANDSTRARGWQVVRVPGWYCYARPEWVVESLREASVVLEDPTSSVVEVRLRR